MRPALRRPAQVTFLTRGAPAAAAVGLGLAFLLGSRHPQARTIALLPAHADTVLVLDLSASIDSDTFPGIGGTVAAFSRSDARVGLVYFSDEAYEALPPGTAAGLAPLVRYFTPLSQKRASFTPSYPRNPWEDTFSGGTRISAGMELAREIAVSSRRRPTVVLVSDLEDAPGDLARLANVLLAFRRDRPVRIVGLDPSRADAAFFHELLGPAVPIVGASTLAQVPPHDRAAFPWSLVALTAAAARRSRFARWAPRLAWAGT